MLNNVLGRVRLTLKAIMLDSMRQGMRSRGRRNAARARTNLSSIFGGFSTAVGNQRRFLRQRATACESLEFRVLLTTWNIGSEAIYPGSVDQFTTIYPTNDNGTEANITIFWGGDHPGFSASYYFFDANGGTGGFSQDLGTNQFVKFIGSTGNDIVRNKSGNGVGTAVELTAYGYGGNDEFYGGQEDDKLIGGPGKDKLFGMAGDDVLYGGLASDNDELTGGTGEDRFYIRSTDVNKELGVGTVLDKHKLDSRVHLVDTTKNDTNGTNEFRPASWSDTDFEAIDETLQHLHEETGSERLMQSHTGGDIYQYRLGLTTTGAADNGAWSNGHDSDWYPSGIIADGSDGLHRKENIVHEILHHFDSPGENPFIVDFRKLSGWIETRPGTFITFADWKSQYPTGGYTGFVQSASKSNDWFNPKGLSSTALFQRDYGGHTPREDFSVTGEFWYNKDVLNKNIAVNLDKQSNLQQFFGDLKKPTTPSDLTIDQSLNINRPTFNWESRVADSFRVQIIGASNNVVRDDTTLELTFPLTADLPAGTYTFLVSSMIDTEEESPTASINFTVNHAPEWVAGVQPPPMAGQNEDDRLAYGTTVVSLTAAASDVDAGAKKGIAISSAPTDKGFWQFTTDGGANWSTFASLGFPRGRNNALLLPANGNLSRVRFVPNQDFNGTVQLGYFAWDQTQGATGGTFDLSTDNKLGGLTAFSNGVHYTTLTVTPVNDAPVWAAGVQPPPMAVQNEDDRLAYGTTVASLTAAASDVDAGAKKGIAISSAPTDKGVWQFTINGGSSWSTLPATTRSNARMLPANGTLSRIRFVPNQDFNGSVQLGYYAWDQTQSWAGGILDISTDNKLGGTTAFGNGIHYTTLTVTPVNDAPVWVAGVQPPPMAVQNEDDRLAYGTTVASLTAAASDVDAGAKKGIAISSAPTDKGVWQFTINGGSSWSALPATTRSNARMLPANGTLSRVRFVPNQDFNGTVQLGYYAWDQTQSWAGGVFDISTDNKLGGTTAFGNGIHYTTLTVTPVNDAPVWVAGVQPPPMAVQNEDDRLAYGTTVASLTAAASDVDAGAKKGIAIHSTSGLESGSWQYTLNGGLNWANFASLGASRNPSKAFLMPANGTLSRIRFVPNQNFNGTVQLGYYAWDQTQGTASGNVDLSTANKFGGTTAFGASTHYASLTVSAVNDAPVWVTSTPPALTPIVKNNFTSSGTTIASITAGVTDVEAGALKGIAIVGAPTGGGKWQFTLDGGNTWTNFPATSHSNARLLPANGTLSRVRFVPNQGFIGNSGLLYFAWDQTQGTAGGTLDISTVNKRGGMTAFSDGHHFSTLLINPV